MWYNYILWTLLLAAIMYFGYHFFKNLFGKKAKGG